MKKWIVVGLMMLGFSVGLPVRNLEAIETGTSLEFGAGYREDNLDWNIAGNLNGNNPNILSELTWSDIEIFQLKAGFKSVFDRVIYMRGAMDYGWIFNGENQDADYNGDNRTLEWSQSNNATDQGSVWDATLGIGYQFKAASDKLKIVPLLGYSYSDQYFNITDGYQTVSVPSLVPPEDAPPAVGPIPGLDSSYEAEWWGPWVGIDLLFDPSEKMRLYAGFEYHWADYQGEADWNLRSDFAHPTSFEHNADGTGIIMTIGGEFSLPKPWFLSLNINYQDWSTDPGLDTLYYADGSISQTRLNEVNWNSFAIMLGLTYRFQYNYPDKPKWMP